MYAESKFLSFQNKAHFRFFYETQDVKVIFPRKIGCLNSFSAKHRIFFPRNTAYIRDFNKRLRIIIIKTALGFFLVFARNKTAATNEITDSITDSEITNQLVQ